MKKTHWKLDKARAMYINRRQWERDFDPESTQAFEIEIEQGGSYIIIETSDEATPDYIITE